VAEPDELSVTDFVTWNNSGGMASGQITRIERDGSIDVPDSDFTINGSEDNPAALIRVWRESENEDGEMEWNPTDVLVGHRFATLTLIASLRGLPTKGGVDLEPPAHIKAIARRAVGVDAAVMVAAGNMTPAMWVDARDTLAASGDTVWGVRLVASVAARFLETADKVIARIEKSNEGRAKGETLSKMETRFSAGQFEIREESDGMVFEGYAAVFDSPSEPLPFIERIAPGAFIRSLKSRNDVKILWNHDTGSILGSTRAGTLSLVEDSRGLKVSAHLPNTSAGRDAAELLRRGDVDSMSFGFSVPRGGDDWNSEGTERTLREVRLHEVSIVAFPAYSATAGTTMVRGLDKVALRAEVDADLLADAMLKIEQGEDITADDRELLAQVIAKLSPEDEVATNEYDMLELKRKKLALLLMGV